jgi:hypothetical protein
MRSLESPAPFDVGGQSKRSKGSIDSEIAATVGSLALNSWSDVPTTLGDPRAININPMSDFESRRAHSGLHNPQRNAALTVWRVFEQPAERRITMAKVRAAGFGPSGDGPAVEITIEGKAPELTVRLTDG